MAGTVQRKGQKKQDGRKIQHLVRVLLASTTELDELCRRLWRQADGKEANPGLKVGENGHAWGEINVLPVKRRGTGVPHKANMLALDSDKGDGAQCPSLNLG